VDLNLTQLDLLLALGNTEGMRMGDLATALITSPANVTRLCASMEERGFVQRRRSEESDRVVVARLTPEGEAAFQELFPRAARFTQSTIASVLDDEECAQLSTLLEKLATARGPEQV
jgi:DNA-binding MarR family transcriptional regulator